MTKPCWREDRALAEDLRQIRRELHRHPELAFEEQRTSRLVVEYLRGLGIGVQVGVANTGVRGVLRGVRAGRTVALRADMDALPIQEAPGREYGSQQPGVMHACGHDAHVACVLGAARLLSGVQGSLAGNVVFLFQPAEEIAAGARAMVEQGVLQDPDVEAIFALHVWPDLPSGTVGVRRGPMFAACDRFRITIRGKGGHGAHPHRAVDPIAAGVQVYSALQTLCSREQNPLLPCVISVGVFCGGNADNVIPQTCELRGTVRTLDADSRQRIAQRVREIVEYTGRSMRADACVEYESSCDIVENDPYLCDLVRAAAAEVVGENRVVGLSHPSLGSEDFAWFVQQVPGAYFRLGTGKVEAGLASPIHTPTFDLDDGEVLTVGASVLARCAHLFLSAGSSSP